MWGSLRTRPRPIVIYSLYYLPLLCNSEAQCQTSSLRRRYPDIFIFFLLKNSDISLEILTKCLQDVSPWLSSRKLKLNPDKTEFLLIGSKVQREHFSKCFLTRLLAQEITPSPSSINLGIVFDSAINFKSHISGISHACYYHIRDMHRIRRLSTPSVAKTIALL